MSQEMKFGLNEQITSAVTLGPLDVSGETRVRLVIENATIANTVVAKARIKGQSNFETLGTFTGSAAQTINVNVYDEFELVVTTYASASSFVKVIASGFNPAEGTDVNTIGVPFGDTITETPILNLTSLDSSVKITGNQVLGTIDFAIASGAHANSIATFAVPAGTNPSATISSDTINLASSDANISITGNATSKTVDFAASSGITNNLTKLENRTVTGTEITNKTLTLLSTPLVATKTRLTIVGGPEQKYSTDYIVSGNTLAWSGLGLDGIIETGDILIISYP